MEKSHPPYEGYPSKPWSAENHPYPNHPGGHQRPSTPPCVQVNYNLPEYNWCEDSQRNKPQSNSLGAATFIFASGGMSLAWGLGFAPQYKYITKGTATHMQICWFVAVIIGACIAAILANKLQKRIFNIVASILVVVNGILFVSDPTSVTSAVIARYCDGIAFGLTIIPAITAGAEQSVKRFRGLVLSIESVGITLGITLKTIYVNSWGTGWDFNTNQMHGCLAIMYGAVALLFAFIFTIESPTFFLRRGQESDALNSLRRLQRPQTVTQETYALLVENKRLLEEDDARGPAENVHMGLVPLAKLCVFRALVAMSFSLPLIMIFVVASTAVSGSDSMWQIYFFGTMRMLGTMTAIFTLDTLGRKLPSVVAMLIGGGLILGVGSVFIKATVFDMETVLALMITHQFMAGFVAPTSTTYLGEAFSISVKPYFILVAVICENVVQIIICCTFELTGFDKVSEFSHAYGSLQVVFAVVILLALPETKKRTLREALAEFKKVLNLKFS